MCKKRAKKREFGICLVLGQPLSFQQKEALSFEHSLCPLGKRGKNLSNIKVKCHVEFIKQEYKASLLYFRFLPCVLS